MDHYPSFPLLPRAIVQRKPPPPPGSPPLGCRPGPHPRGPHPKAFPLHGDISGLEMAFKDIRRTLVGSTVPGSILAQMLEYPGSISGYFEDAVAAFDGDLPALVMAAVRFVRERKLRATTDPIQVANGRVHPETFNRIKEIEQALAPVKGMSRAKVMAGLIQLKLDQQGSTR